MSTYEIVPDPDALRVHVYYDGPQEHLRSLSESTTLAHSDVYPAIETEYDHAVHFKSATKQAINQIEQSAENHLATNLSEQSTNHAPGSSAKENKIDRIVNILAKIDLFETATGQDLELLAENSHIKTTESGETIIERGNYSRSFMIVESGEFGVFLDKPEDFLARFESGDYFGEMSLFSDLERSANVISLSEGSVIEIPVKKFRQLLQNNTKLGSKILMVFVRTLSDRLREMNDRVTQ